MAKEQKQEQTPPAPDAPEVAGPPKSYRLYIALAFVSLILLQMIVLFLALPAKQIPPKIGVDVQSAGNIEGVTDTPADPIKVPATVEKIIGDNKSFKISNPVDGDLTDSFSVIMYVKVRKSDESKFDRRYAACTIELIDRVTVELTGSTTEERNETKRTAIRERVKKAINEVLGTPWVQEVLLTEVVHTVT